MIIQTIESNGKENGHEMETRVIWGLYGDNGNYYIMTGYILGLVYGRVFLVAGVTYHGVRRTPHENVNHMKRYHCNVTETSMTERPDA